MQLRSILIFFASLSMILMPATSLASVGVGWNATSTNIGFIQPNAVNGNLPFLKFNSFVATSTTATSTANLLKVATYLNVGGLPGYGYFPEDLVDVWNPSTGNDLTAVNVGSAQTGSCAQSVYALNGDNLTLNQDFTTISNTNSGYAGGSCTILSPTNVNPESTYIYQPTWDMYSVLGTTTNTVNGIPVGFKWLTANGATQAAVLTNQGNLGIATTTPFAQLSLNTPAGFATAYGTQFAIASSTAGTATTTIFSVGSNANSQVLVSLGGSAGSVLNSVSSTMNLQVAGSSKLSVGSTQISFATASFGAAGSAANGHYPIGGVVDTGLAANLADYPIFVYNFGQTRKRTSGGGAATQVNDIIVTPSIEDFTSGNGTLANNTITTASSLLIKGTPTPGANSNITNTYGLQITSTTTATTASTTNAVAFGAMTPLNATNNYVGSTTGRWIMNSLTSSAGLQTAVACFNASNELIFDTVACLASGRRFKQDIEPLAATSSLAELMSISPVSYYYKPSFNGNLQSDPNYNGEYKGFIADDVGKVDPTLIKIETGTTTNAADPSLNSYPGMAAGLKIDNIVAVLWSAVQEVVREVDGEQAQLDAQQKEIDSLQAQINALKK